MIYLKATSAEPLDNGTAEAVKNIKTSYQVMRTHLKEAKYSISLSFLFPFLFVSHFSFLSFLL